MRIKNFQKKKKKQDKYRNKKISLFKNIYYKDLVILISKKCFRWIYLSCNFRWIAKVPEEEEEAEGGEAGVGVGGRVEGVTDSVGVIYRAAGGGGGSLCSSPLWTTVASSQSV